MSTRRDVAPRILSTADASKRGDGPFVHQRAAVHHEEAHVALRRFGQVLLDDGVAIARDRLDHLIDVRPVLGSHQEHAGAAGALKRLDHRMALLGLDELLDLVRVPADARARANGFGEVLEVGLVDGIGEVDRVVDHQHAARRCQLTEEDPTRLRPRAFGGVLGGVVSQHHHVEVVDRHAHGILLS